jgi:hypothetical protein
MSTTTRKRTIKSTTTVMDGDRLSQQLECLQKRMTYPGGDVMESTFTDLHKQLTALHNTVLFVGGWSMHHFLKSIDPSLALYDETNPLCSGGDFDVFCRQPVTTLINVTRDLKRNNQQLDFSISSGMHPNQYTMSINFVGTKLVDMLYMSPRVFDALPKLTIDGNFVLHPLVELTRQYFLLSNVFLMGPKVADIGKVLKRVAMLEEHALTAPEWWSEPQRGGDSALSPTGKHRWSSAQTAAVARLCREWLPTTGGGALVGETALLVAETAMTAPHDLQTAVVAAVSNGLPELGLEIAVHDATFAQTARALLKALKDMIPKTEHAKVRVIHRRALAGLVGPLYNGWIEVWWDRIKFVALYSHAVPVHCLTARTPDTMRVASFYHSVPHVTWTALLHKMDGATTARREATRAVIEAVSRKRAFGASKPQYTYCFDAPCFAGTFPVRNFFMVWHLRRKRRQDIFQYQTGARGAAATAQQNAKHTHRDLDGRVERSAWLSKTHRFGEVPFGFLYDRLAVAAQPTQSGEPSVPPSSPAHVAPAS